MVTGQLSRVSKLFIDRDGMTADEARDHRAACGIALVCGRDVARSYGLQTAVITAAELAARCFPGAVRVVLDSGAARAPLRLWRARRVTLGEALAATLGSGQLVVDGEGDSRADVIGLVFGDAEFNGRAALRVTFDGWIAATGPVATVERLGERDHCPLAAVLAASLAVSEVFMEFSGTSVEATRRAVGLSLWRPDVDIGNPDAQGVEVEYLPKELCLMRLPCTRCGTAGQQRSSGRTPRVKKRTGGRSAWRHRGEVIQCLETICAAGSISRARRCRCRSWAPRPLALYWRKSCGFCMRGRRARISGCG